MIVPQQKIIWLCSYPKSGNTWMRLFLNTLSKNCDNVNVLDSIIGGDAMAASKLLLNDCLGVDTEELSADDIQKVRAQAYQVWSSALKEDTFAKVHDTAFYKGSLLFPHNVTKKVIYIVRNPFDVAVSVSHYLNISIQQSVDAICDEQLLIADTVNGFKSLVPQYLGSWSNHYYSWKKAYGSNMLLIRYEDMLRDGLAAFTNLTDYLGWNKSESEIQKALEICSFSNLQKMERISGFKEKPKSTEMFFRNGQVGDWRNYLTSDQTQQIIDANFSLLRELKYIDSIGNIIV
jgi:aryl sulfotransferase